MLDQKTVRNLVHRTKLLGQYYRPYGRRATPEIVYVIDNYKKDHGGLADRLKQILGMYAYCKFKNIKFKLIFNIPFELSDYLLPNYDWTCIEGLSRNIFFTKPVYLGYITEAEQLKRLSIPNKQLHVYANSNWSTYLKISNYKVSDLFFELFKPSELLSSEVQKYRDKYKKWDSVVFRFQNLLNDFNEPASVAFKKKIGLTSLEKEELINKCLDFVADYAAKSPIPVLVCTDSKIFIDKVKSIENVFIIPGDLVHMNFTKDKSTAVHFKPFLDFFMIMNSNKVLRVGTDFMYPSGFPLLASQVGMVDFEIVVFE